MIELKYMIIYVLNILDLFFTSKWVNEYGIESELNPIGKFLLQYDMVFEIKLCVNLVLLIIIYIFEVFYDNKFAKICSYIITAFYSIIVLIHIILLIWIKK